MIAAFKRREAGADVMTGGLGNDTFQYTSLLDAGDSITDFSSAACLAATADVRFFYETGTGILRFDADGNLGGSAAIIIAALQPGATMTIADIAFL